MSRDKYLGHFVYVDFFWEYFYQIGLNVKSELLARFSVREVKVLLEGDTERNGYLLIRALRQAELVRW